MPASTHNQIPAAARPKSSVQCHGVDPKNWAAGADIAAAAQLEELQPLGSLLVLLYAQGASPETQQAVFQQVQNARTAHSYPFGLMELTRDLLAIDQVISDDPCSLTFLADGQAVTPEGPTAAVSLRARQ